MKILKLIYTFLFLFMLTSCLHNDEENIPTENNQKKSLDIDFSNLKLDLNIDFKPDNISFFSGDFKTIKKNLNADLEKLNYQINNRIKNDKDTDVIVYQITINKKGYTIHNWAFLSLNQATGKFGDPNPYDSWSQPSASTQVGNACYNEACVADNISSALANISSGDTVVITVHHGEILEV